MADAIAIIHDLKRRVMNLERHTATNRHARRHTTPLSPESAAILNYLRTATTPQEDNRDSEAILAYLRDTKKKTRQQLALRRVPAFTKEHRS